jgi:hypothetical protein
VRADEQIIVLNEVGFSIFIEQFGARAQKEEIVHSRQSGSGILDRIKITWLKTAIRHSGGRVYPLQVSNLLPILTKEWSRPREGAHSAAREADFLHKKSLLP